MVRGFRGPDRAPAGPGRASGRRARGGAGARLVLRGGPRRDSLRRRDQRGRWGRAAGRRRLSGGGDDRPAPPRPGARGGRRLERGADPGRRAGPASRGSAPRAWADAAPLPAVVRVLHPRAAGSRPAPAGTSRRCYTHIDDLVESVRALTPGGAWESRRLPGLRGRPQPRPPAARLGGDPRGDHGGLGAGPGAARVGSSPAGSPSTRSRPAPRRCGSCRSPGLNPSNCRLLDPAESALTHAGPAGQGAAGAGLRVGAPSGGRADGMALEVARDHGGEPGR